MQLGNLNKRSVEQVDGDDFQTRERYGEGERRQKFDEAVRRRRRGRPVSASGGGAGADLGRDVPAASFAGDASRRCSLPIIRF